MLPVRPHLSLATPVAGRVCFVLLPSLFLLLLPLGVAAQPLSTGDLADTWRVTYLAVPTGAFTASALHTYKGDVTFDASGVASGTLIVDEFSAGELTFTVTGSLALSAQGIATGTLTLTGTDTRALVVEEARILVNRHTIVGAVTLHRPGGTDTGLVTLLRLTEQTFSRINDLAATWNYHEITPSNALKLGDADWIQGKIDFHQDGCTVATLFFADGTIRAQPNPNDPTSFG
jgi:hypothetical protein